MRYFTRRGWIGGGGNAIVFGPRSTGCPKEIEAGAYLRVNSPTTPMRVNESERPLQRPEPR